MYYIWHNGNEIDALSMILFMGHNWMVGYKYWHEIGMHDNLMFGW